MQVKMFLNYSISGRTTTTTVRIGAVFCASTPYKEHVIENNVLFLLCLFSCVLIDSGRAWLEQLVRSLPSDSKVPSSSPALPRFESLCDLLFRLSQLSFPSFRGR